MVERADYSLFMIHSPPWDTTRRRLWAARGAFSRYHHGRMASTTNRQTPRCEFHVSRRARDRYGFDQELFGSTGNVVFADFRAAREFADRMNRQRDLEAHPEQAVKASEINAMGLIDEILHLVVRQYRWQINPDVHCHKTPLPNSPQLQLSAKGIKILTVAPARMLGFRSLLNFSLRQANTLIDEGYNNARMQLKPHLK